MSEAPHAVKCPTCKATVVWTAASRWRPFCSERCKLIDLGEWFEERHRIPGAALNETGEALDETGLDTDERD